MGKKKKAKRAAEQGFQAPPALAGVAAALARQVTTPAGRQMIAGALVAAAGAIAGRDAVRAASPPVPPAPPVSPIPPVPPEPRAAYAPNVEVPNFALPPEATRAIGAAASALERWAQGFAKPKPPAE